MSKKNKRKNQERKQVGEPKQKDCGCIETTFSDDTVDITPCPPCGLMEVARNLNKAATAMASVATVLNQEQVRQQKALAAQEMVAEAARQAAAKKE